MYLNTHDIEIPVFEEKRDAENWIINSFYGIRLWHATRVLESDDIQSSGLKVPTKESLDKRLLDWVKNKHWYNPEVESIVHEHPLVRGEPLAVYGVLDKEDLFSIGMNHYVKYGSEYWQRVLGMLSASGYGVGRDELLNYGQSYIIGIDVHWKSMCTHDIRAIVDSIFENDTYNTGIALFRDVLPNEISSIEQC